MNQGNRTVCLKQNKTSTLTNRKKDWICPLIHEEMNQPENKEHEAKFCRHWDLGNEEEWSLREGKWSRWAPGQPKRKAQGTAQSGGSSFRGSHRPRRLPFTERGGGMQEFQGPTWWEWSGIHHDLVFPSVSKSSLFSFLHRVVDQILDYLVSNITKAKNWLVAKWYG